MYIQRRSVRYWSNLAKSLWDDLHLLAGLRFSLLKVQILSRRKKLASKQMQIASAITFIVHRP